jgi:hypothetical protein
VEADPTGIEIDIEGSSGDFYFLFFFDTVLSALFSGFLPKVFVKNPFWSFQFEIFTLGYKSSCFYVLVPRLT